MDFQATNNWRVTGRYMKNKEDILQAYGTTWAGNGSDQLPTPVLFVHPGSNYMLSATGILNPTTSLEVSLGPRGQLAELRAAAARSCSAPTRASRRCRCCSPTRSRPTTCPSFRFRGGRTGNAGQYQTDRGPFTNENITHDVIANLTKVWGAHASKAGFYFQHSFKPQSIFASFNSQINFTDNTNNPFDTGYSYANAATGVFNSYTQANKFALPEWRYKNIEFYAQDNWKPSSRLTLDYGVRFYYLTPQWDTTLQASNFLPDQFNPAAAAKLYTPVCVGGAAVRRLRIGAAWIRRSSPPASTPTLGNTVEGRFIGRLTPGSNRFNGAFQAGQGINDQLQDGSAFRVSPRVGVVYDLTGKGATIVRGGFGHLLRPAAGQHGVRHDRQRAGRAELDRCSGARLQDLTSAGGDPDPTLSLNPTAFDFKPPRVNQWNFGVQHKLCRTVILDVAYVGSTSTDLLRQVQINALPFGATFAPQNQDPTRVASTRRARRRCRTTSCGPSRATATSGCGTTAATRTTTRCRRRSPAASTAGSCSRASTCGARRSASTATTSRLACRT